MKEALKLALEALKDLLDQTETPPDTNCSCHIAPPCNDCVDYSGVRYAIEQANKAIAAGKEALAQPEQKPFTYYDPVRDAIRPFPVDGDIPLYTTHNIGDKS